MAISFAQFSTFRKQIITGCITSCTIMLDGWVQYYSICSNCKILIILYDHFNDRCGKCSLFFLTRWVIRHINTSLTFFFNFRVCFFFNKCGCAPQCSDALILRPPTVYFFFFFVIPIIIKETPRPKQPFLCEVFMDVHWEHLGGWAHRLYFK